MRRVWLGCVLAASAASAQTPAPEPALLWNEAQLTWAAPTEFAAPGGSLPDPLPSITYTIETLDPGSTTWRVVTKVTHTSNKFVRLPVGLHQWRVSASWTDGDGTMSAPTAPVSKLIVPPPPGPPTAFNVR